MSYPYLPIEDSVTTLFWQATRNRNFLLQYCPGCEHFQFYPRALCIKCGEEGLEWRSSTGEGIIDSWTEVCRPPTEGFLAPYTIVRVRLNEGPIVLSRLVDSNEVSCDQPVWLAWEELSDGRALPVFTTKRGN